MFASKREKFSAEFKRGAVEQARQSVVSCVQGAFSDSGTLRDEDLVHLKRELARMQKERDFLPEAAAFFAKRSSRGIASQDQEFSAFITVRDLGVTRYGVLAKLDGPTFMLAGQ